MELAVIRIAGKQHLVTPNCQIIVSGFLGKVGETIEIPEVLLWQENGKVEIGAPTLTKKVTAKVEAQGKGEKVHVRKFKAKSRYRRLIGFRAQETRLLVLPSEKQAEKPLPPKTKVNKTKKS